MSSYYLNIYYAKLGLINEAASTLLGHTMPKLYITDVNDTVYNCMQAYINHVFNITKHGP